MRFIAVLCLAFVAAPSIKAQLTVEQRRHDFQNLAALYAKRYAPYDWKRQAVGFDLFDLSRWLPRVAAAKDDLEFLEICAEYVASLDDLHSSFRFPSSFFADLRIFVDIYDGKVLIDSIDRLRLPATVFPFQIGDELVSLDGKTAEQWITENSKLLRRGNTLTTRRSAADLITFRPQSVLPRAVELGNTARVVIRRLSGDLETYEIPWVKSGFPIFRIGPVPNPVLSIAPGASAAQAAEDDQPFYLKMLDEMQNWKVSPNDPLLQGTIWSDETQQDEPRRYVLGWGSRAPTFRLPTNFVQRLGTGTDFHYSGTYESDGMRIGYLRFPNFSPNVGQAIQELEREVAYFQDNTDGLVVDVMRNTGGGCYMLDAARRLIPGTFFFFGEQIRVTMDRINSMRAALESARARNAESWIIETFQVYLNELLEAYNRNRGLTNPIPACSAFTPGVSALPPGYFNEPAAVVYRKPMIILVDEFSTSAGDIFPAMLQDNQRGPLVGTRTNGAGGSISAWPTGFYSEAQSSNTNSLVVRIKHYVTDDYPPAPYIENVGARADIRLEYMTRENLLTRGEPFVRGFTQILVDEVRRQR